ncbi:MAG TPA: 3D domain-containing protein [Patescibacteria group bacterium]
MRIIRIAALLLLLAIAAIIPQIAMADEQNNTDTNINTIFPTLTNILSAETASANEGVLPVDQQKSADELRDELLLAQWKDKQSDKWSNLPKNSFVINASAYTAAADECGNSKGVTSSGLKVQEKRTLACPPEFPFGAKIEIDGMGTYTCEDRGGAIKGNHIDIYMQTKDEAFAFGRQDLTAKVVF